MHHKNFIIDLYGRCHKFFYCKLILAWYYVYVLGLPSSFFLAYIRSSVSALFIHCAALLPSQCADSCLLLCVAFTLHPPMRYILLLLLCIGQALFILALHPDLPFHVSTRLGSFMRCILPLPSCISQASFIFALRSALFTCISYKTWSLPDLFFSLAFIKTGTQLYIQEIRADRYKTPCWPIRPLFSLVHIA